MSVPGIGGYKPRLQPSIGSLGAGRGPVWESGDSHCVQGKTSKEGGDKQEPGEGKCWLSVRKVGHQ